MFIFSNLASSVDGKISTASRVHFYLGTPADRKNMMVLRARADAILVGASTLRVFPKPMLTPLLPGNAQPLNVVLSSRLDRIEPDWPFFKSGKIKRILFIGHRASKKKAKLFERSCEVVFLKPSATEPAARQIIEAMKRRSVKNLLLEGGGELLWEFARHSLVDEYHVTLTPGIVAGREAPTMVEGDGFTPSEILKLKLMQCKVVGDEIYLIYRRRRGR